MAGPVRLVARFVRSAIPLGPSRAHDEWARGRLLESEVGLWRQMRSADRRHAVAVGRRVEAALGDEATRPVLAAALLLDVGKIDARFGAYRRLIAEVSGAAVRHDPAVIKAWTRTTGFTRRVGLYLQYPRLGGDLLGIAGSDPLTETLVREQLLPEDEWSAPVAFARVLRD